MASLYSVKRDEICVGKVITDFEILKDGRNLMGQKMEFGHFYPYRSMLFIPTMDGYADDLLYESPQYPIHKKCNDEMCENSKIIIKGAQNIGRMLKYYGYGDELDFLDVQGIRTTYFNGTFPLRHLDDFGLIEIGLEPQNYYDSQGRIILDPQKIKEFEKIRKRQQLFGLRREFTQDPAFDELSLSDLNRFLLDTKYFEILRAFGDKSLAEVLWGYEERRNAFKPHKEEGPIRSLKRYN